jgi:ribonuclease VapC
MIVDSSALISILLGEHDASALSTALSHSRINRISAGTLLETAIVADSPRSAVLSGRLDELLTHSRIRVEPVTESQAVIARQAHRDFGRGSGHPARLNYGDCFAYALAKELGEPLLFRGDDFGHTDLRSALPASTD